MDIPKYTIMHWQRETHLFNPVKRHGMYMYTEEDIKMIIGIKYMTQQGFRLKAIVSRVKEDGRQAVLQYAEGGLITRILRELKDAEKEVKGLIAILKQND